MSDKPEPGDRHCYQLVRFDSSTSNVLLASVSFYEQLLNADIQALENDPDLASLVDEHKRNDLPIYRELKKVARVREWMKQVVDKGSVDAWDFGISISHGTVRFLKATAGLYLAHLRNRRDRLATRPNVSRHLLETIDTELARFQEFLQSGVFAQATPMPLLFDQVAELSPSFSEPTAPTPLAKSIAPRPVVISSIEILDLELRSRCLDLFEAFREDGQRDRLDTVITEATRILENRIRALSKAPAERVGQDLARYAFGGDSPILLVSQVPAEQEAAHLMFRGVFGFVRNQVHHRLSGELAPERVLQVLGLVDYLIALAQGATRQPPAA